MSASNSPPTASSPDSLLAANIRYGHSVGWSFTPLAGKRPTLKGWQDRPHEALEDALAWAAKGNVGLRTGRISGTIIIDVDPGGDVGPLNLPGTVTAMTGRPGAYHLYFQYPEGVGNSSGRLGPHIDVRGDGGQVVYPGSIHPETALPYTWAEGREPWNVELAELPADVIERLRAAAPPRRTKTKTTDTARPRTDATTWRCQTVPSM